MCTLEQFEEKKKAVFTDELKKEFEEMMEKTPLHENEEQEEKKCFVVEGNKVFVICLHQISSTPKFEEAILAGH